MPIVTNGRLLYLSHPTGFQKPGVHTKYVEEQIDLENIPLNGGILIRTLALSSDPYIRFRMRDPSIPLVFPPLALGHPVDNQGVGIVIRSDKPEFKPGDFVRGYLTFENYCIYPGHPEQRHAMQYLNKIDKHEDLPASIYVGTLGMPGNTAYSGWNAFVKEKAKTSKTLFVNSAAGAVGTFVIEYARYTNPHLKIIASAGSPDKLEVLKSAGANVVFDYKTADTAEVLAEHGPIDIFWDHVGGTALDAALENMAFFGLIVRVGTSTIYNGQSVGIKNISDVVTKSLTVQGLVYAIGDAMQKASVGFHGEATKLVLEGKIKSRETRYEGLKEAGNALADIHTGKYSGKLVIVVAEQ